MVQEEASQFEEFGVGAEQVKVKQSRYRPGVGQRVPGS